jgi:hypothetical protein
MSTSQLDLVEEVSSEVGCQLDRLLPLLPAADTQPNMLALEGSLIPQVRTSGPEVRGLLTPIHSAPLVWPYLYHSSRHDLKANLPILTLEF